MLKDNIARFVCAIVSSLFLLLHFGACAAEKPAESAPELRIDRFELAIKGFEWRDRHWPPPQGGVVFVGSSTLTKWRNLQRTFREFRAINRGFGGATIPEVNHYVSRIVTKYKPAKVVFYCGSNDIAELHHDGNQVFDDFKTFVNLVHEKLPACQIYFVSESAAPCRQNFESDFSQCNSLVQAYIKSTPKLHYINVLPVMQDANGKLRNELFGPDHLHMNAAGYALWTPIIKAALKSND